MPRSLVVLCPDGHREEIVIGINEIIPNCKCGKAREILWDVKGPGFRVQGMTKNFRMPEKK